MSAPAEPMAAHAGAGRARGRHVGVRVRRLAGPDEQRHADPDQRDASRGVHRLACTPPACPVAPVRPPRHVPGLGDLGGGGHLRRRPVRRAAHGPESPPGRAGHLRGRGDPAGARPPRVPGPGPVVHGLSPAGAGRAVTNGARARAGPGGGCDGHVRRAVAHGRLPSERHPCGGDPAPRGRRLHRRLASPGTFRPHIGCPCPATARPVGTRGDRHRAAGRAHRLAVRRSQGARGPSLPPRAGHLPLRPGGAVGSRERGAAQPRDLPRPGPGDAEGQVQSERGQHPAVRPGPADPVPHPCGDDRHPPR